MLAVAACTRAPDRSADTAAPAIAVNSPSPAPAPAPDPAKQRAFWIVFETDGQRLTAYRSGRRPAVEYVEGCS